MCSTPTKEAMLVESKRSDGRRRNLAVAITLWAAAVVLVGATSGSAIFGANDDRTRPHPAGFTEGYGNEKVTAFAYPQQFYCTDEPTDDLDGPGHNGDGIKAAQDPDEFQHPAMGPPGSPCIVGRTARGSLPRIDPTGRPIDQAEPVWAILPYFDSSEDADATLEVVDPTRDGADVQCPEPGPPHTNHSGAFGTCTMHPSTLHAEPIGLGDIPLPNHSHIIDGDSSNAIWWQTIAVRVFDERIWPNFDGRCPANPEGGEPCLISLAALRAAQQTGQAGPDVKTNVFLFFDSKQVNGIDQP
jgi:hypothetical protein